jgi:hypothetical protein
MLERERCMDHSSKAALLAQLRRLRQAGGKEDDTVKGGYGYCTLYTDSFRRSFGTGTGIAHDVVCPTVPGGNVDNFLYLTAMNRARFGVEAHPLYYKQNQVQFRVYDWARPDGQRGQMLIPFSALADYLYTTTDQTNTSYQVITVQNLTYQISATDWTNDILLWNNRHERLDRIYKYNYQSTTDQQQEYGPSGWWGPDVETFQDHYTDTNVLGFLDVVIFTRPDGIADDWTPPISPHLGEHDVTVRQDNLGFEVVRLVPYRDILVKGGRSFEG